MSARTKSGITSKWARPVARIFEPHPQKDLLARPPNSYAEMMRDWNAVAERSRHVAQDIPSHAL